MGQHNQNNQHNKQQPVRPPTPPPAPRKILDRITTEASILPDGVCEIIVCVPKVMADRLLSKANKRELGEFLHDEIIRRSIEGYVY